MYTYMYLSNSIIYIFKIYTKKGFGAGARWLLLFLSEPEELYMFRCGCSGKPANRHTSGMKTQKFLNIFIDQCL